MIMAVWRNMGTLMIIFLAGLQAIPEELKEAAAIDGASKWRTFRSITLPLMKPTLLLGAVLLSVGYLQFFEESFVMTQGGPLDSTCRPHTTSTRSSDSASTASHPPPAGCCSSSSPW